MGVAQVGNQRVWLSGEVQSQDLLAIAQWYNNNFYGYAANYWGNAGKVTAVDFNNFLSAINNGAGSWWHPPAGMPGPKNPGDRIVGGVWFNAPTVTFSPYGDLFWSNTNNNRTIPPGCTSITISALFAGGGGGGGGTQQENGGGGGGGGSSGWVIGRTIGVSAGNTLNSLIGVGGQGSYTTSDNYGFYTSAAAGTDTNVLINGNTVAYAHAGGPGGDAGPFNGGSGGSGGASDNGAGAGGGNGGASGAEGGSNKTGHGKSAGGNGGGTPWGAGGNGGNSSNGWLGQKGGAEGCGGGGGGNNDGDGAQRWSGAPGQDGVAAINFNS